jgi:hypothetical protein
MRVRANEASGQRQSGVWWALASGAVGFDAGWLIGRSQ